MSQNFFRLQIHFCESMNIQAILVPTRYLMFWGESRAKYTESCYRHSSDRTQLEASRFATSPETGRDAAQAAWAMAESDVFRNQNNNRWTENSAAKTTKYDEVALVAEVVVNAELLCTKPTKPVLFTKKNGRRKRLKSKEYYGKIS